MPTRRMNKSQFLTVLLKLNVVERPATAQHKGIHPLTRELMTYKARGARKVIKVRPLRALLDAL